MYSSVIFLLSAAAFMASFAALSWWMDTRDPARQRLAGLASDTATAEERRSAGETSATPWFTRLAPFSRWLLPGTGKERGRIERLLTLAGFRDPKAISIFFGAKMVLAATLPFVWAFFAAWLPRLSSNQILLVAFALIFVGLLAPNRWLVYRVEQRQRRLREGFPDALDLLVICVEAGLGLTAAIERVGTELRFTYPELAADLALVNMETRAGVDRELALHNLNERTGLPEIRGLVSLLAQTLRFGTGIADSLRVYSAEFRDQRMQKAEERAAKIGTQLIFPLILCLFPSFFAVAVGPAAIRLLEAFATR